jgi:hypothetical protein
MHPVSLAETPARCAPMDGASEAIATNFFQSCTDQMQVVGDLTQCSNLTALDRQSLQLCSQLGGYLGSAANPVSYSDALTKSTSTTWSTKCIFRPPANEAVKAPRLTCSDATDDLCTLLTSMKACKAADPADPADTAVTADTAASECRVRRVIDVLANGAASTVSCDTA